MVAALSDDERAALAAHTAADLDNEATLENVLPARGRRVSTRHDSAPPGSPVSTVVEEAADRHVTLGAFGAGARVGHDRAARRRSTSTRASRRTPPSHAAVPCSVPRPTLGAAHRRRRRRVRTTHIDQDPVFPLRDPDATRLTAAAGAAEQKKLETRAALNEAAVDALRRRRATSRPPSTISVAKRTCRCARSSATSKARTTCCSRARWTSRRSWTRSGPSTPTSLRSRRSGDAYLAQPRLSAADAAQAVLFQRAMGSDAVLQGRYVAGMEYFRGEVAQALAARAGRPVATDEDILAATIGQATLDHAYRRWLDRERPRRPPADRRARVLRKCGRPGHARRRRPSLIAPGSVVRWSRARGSPTGTSSLTRSVPSSGRSGAPGSTRDAASSTKASAATSS